MSRSGNAFLNPCVSEIGKVDIPLVGVCKIQTHSFLLRTLGVMVTNRHVPALLLTGQKLEKWQTHASVKLRSKQHRLILDKRRCLDVLTPCKDYETFEQESSNSLGLQTVLNKRFQFLKRFK